MMISLFLTHNHFYCCYAVSFQNSWSFQNLVLLMLFRLISSQRHQLKSRCTIPSWSPQNRTLINYHPGSSKGVSLNVWLLNKETSQGNATKSSKFYMPFLRSPASFYRSTPPYYRYRWALNPPLKACPLFQFHLGIPLVRNHHPFKQPFPKLWEPLRTCCLPLKQ